MTMPIYELRFRERLGVVSRDATASKLTDEQLRSECVAIHDAMSAFRQSWLADMDALSKTKPGGFQDAFYWRRAQASGDL